MIEALSKPQEYWDDMGPPNRIACFVTFFTNEEKYANSKGHNRPIFISGTYRNKPISRVINGLEVNIISSRMLLAVVTVGHLKHKGRSFRAMIKTNQGY